MSAGDLQTMRSLCSRLKLSALSMRALGDPFKALRYFKAAYELEDDLIERLGIQAEIALLEFEWVAKARPDLQQSIQEAQRRVLRDHGLVEAPASAKKRKK